MRQIPSDMENKLASQNLTKYEDSDPRVEVIIARARSSIMDASYFTVENIRTKEGLTDISIATRRQKAYGPPDGLFVIELDNGIAKTLTKAYPDKLKAGWQEAFTLEAAIAVAASFDGEWGRYKDTWQLQTGEYPYIFWVDSTGKLWSQHWDDETTKYELTTGVSKVKAIRAWKNVTSASNDQGIVVAYIKTDGKVYYRNYCQQVDYTYMWEYEKEVTEFTNTAINLNMFLTNDYRLGFIIEDSLGKFHWLMTPRNWSGMASPQEFIEAGIKDVQFEVYEIEYKEQDTYDEQVTTAITDVWFNVAEPIYPEPTFAENPDGSEIQLLLKFSHEIDYDLAGVKTAFTITDSLGAVFTIDTTEAGVDNSEIIFNMPNFAGASGDMYIAYDRSVIELDCLNEGSRFIIESFSFEFTPDLAPPEGFENENITVGITDVAFSVKDIQNIDAIENEHVTVAIADITFTVTKVGDNPL